MFGDFRKRTPVVDAVLLERRRLDRAVFFSLSSWELGLFVFAV